MGCREDEFDSGKDSKDKVIGDSGRSFLDMINEKDGIFLNGYENRGIGMGNIYMWVREDAQ